MAPVEGHEVVLTRQEVEAGRLRLLDGEVPVAFVAHDGRAGDHVNLGEDAVEQGHLETEPLVAERHREGLRMVGLVRRVDGGQAGKAVLPVRHLVAHVAKVAPEGPPRVTDGERGTPEVPDPLDGVLEREGVEAVGTVVTGCVGRRGESTVGMREQVVHAARRPSPVVEVEKEPIPVDLHLVGGTPGRQGDGARAVIEDDGHGCTRFHVDEVRTQERTPDRHGEDDDCLASVEEKGST